MKTELQIAKENVQFFKSHNNCSNTECKTHKQTCQRFLDFLEGDLYFCDNCEESYECKCKEMCLQEAKFSHKITDLKQAIKHYEENGI